MRAACLAALLALALLAPGSAQARSGSARIPPEAQLLESLRILLGPAARARGPQGSVRMILGTHHRGADDVHTLFYCTAPPRSDRIQGGGGRGECFSDVVLLELEGTGWVLRSERTAEWVLIRHPVR